MKNPCHTAKNYELGLEKALVSGTWTETKKMYDGGFFFEENI